MLNEAFADGSLEKIMAMAEDDVLKAISPEDKKTAIERYANLHRIYNERLKIQNDYASSEARIVMDSEKFDYEKQKVEAEIEAESKRSNKDFIKDIAITAAKLGMVGAEIAFQGIMIHNSLIETDAVSKSATKGILGTVSNYLRV